MPAELKRYRQITYCIWCKLEGRKVRAIWMSKYPPAWGVRDHSKHYACNTHKHRIEDTDPDRTRAAVVSYSAKKEDDHMTEADYQTWWRL